MVGNNTDSRLFGPDGLVKDLLAALDATYPGSYQIAGDQIFITISQDQFQGVIEGMEDGIVAERIDPDGKL
jgi:hypothetical protein